MSEVLGYMSVIITNPLLLLLVAVGCFAGVYIGAIPGLSGTMAISILVSFTFGWKTESALALMIGVFVGVVYGGSRSAILLNIPGAPAAVATAFDGYPLAKKGLAGKAMGIATTSSIVGTFIGILALVFLAPAISSIAGNFRSVDYLLLATIGLFAIGSLGGKSLVSGIIGACIGLFIGCIGIDSQTAVKRFTFDIVYLNSGINFVVAMIGLFGASEVFYQLSNPSPEKVTQTVDKIIPSFKTILSHLPLTIKSAIVGVLVGALPGAGGDIAAIMSYDLARKTTKNPSAPFGEGAVEGVIAPETANNAAIGGAFIPMLTLGIPGDAITAVLISALSIHGVKVGPSFVSSSPDLFWLIVALLIAGGIFLVIFGLSGIKLFSKVTNVPRHILLPIILILSVVGSYAIRNNIYDIFWMFGFGLFGFFLKKFHFPVAPVILGTILINLFETNFRRGIVLEGSFGGLLASIIKSPISIGLLVIMFIAIVLSILCRNQKS